MHALPNDRARVTLAIALFAVLAAVASVSSQLTENTWLFRDGRFYVNVTTTLVEDLSLEQHRFAASWYSGTLGWNRDLDPGWSNVALGRHGEHWPKHPYLLPLFASPLYFALGLPATLLFNLLMYGVIAAGLYRFARAYTEPESAALASALFVFASIIVGSAYDYSTDVLMLALFAVGLASVKERRGVVAGVAMGLCVIIKPTALMLLPSLVLFFFERTDPRMAAPLRGTTRAELARALLGGTVVLGLFAAANTWMYGLPWWSGYNRTLVTSGGAPSVASHTDAFSVPFAQGLDRVLHGDYGLLAAFAVLTLSVPGLGVLTRTRPRAALAIVLGVGLSLTVFSRYVYEGHRFHWPALALTVPALAATFAWLARRGVRSLREGARRGRLPEGVLAGAAALAATMFTVVGAARGRLGGGAWVDAALDALPDRLAPEVAPFVVIALHALAVAVLVGALAASLEGPRALRAAAVLVPFGVPEVRLGLQQGGLALVVLALVALGCASLVRGSVRVGEGAVWRTPAARVALGLFVGALGCALSLPHAAEGTSLWAALRESWWTRSEARALWPVLLPAALGGLVLANDALAAATPRSSAERSHRGAIARLLGAKVLGATLLTSCTMLGASLATTVALAWLFASALAVPLVWRLAGLLGRAAPDRRGLLRLALLALAGCLAIGLARRVEAGARPFELASEAAVRDALVFLEQPGLGEVPCDFLAWEHLSWECATFDRGVHGEVGLAIDEPARVGGASPRTLLLPSGARGERRRVVWPEARAGRELTVRWVVPDNLRGSGVLIVRVDDRELGRIELSTASQRGFEERRWPTPGLGDRARLELELRDARGPSAVALQGEWR